MNGNNNMTIRDFDKLLFFHGILWFLGASFHANNLEEKIVQNKMIIFAKKVWAFAILTTICVEKQYFSYYW